MSLEADKQTLLTLLESARSRAEQAIASFNNGDLEKAKVRITQYNDAFKEANKILGIVQEKKASKDKGELTRDDLSK
jgi:cellobiose-specific phosphotransferase system component IIA